MRIYFWFLILAVAILAVNLLMIIIMYKRKTIRSLPVISVTILGFILAALLYLLTVIHGTELLGKKLAASLEIETESYQTAATGEGFAYAFCSKEGIECTIHSAQLLDPDVPQQPTTVEIYYCRTRCGFSWCYLSEDTAVYYILK